MRYVISFSTRVISIDQFSLTFRNARFLGSSFHIYHNMSELESIISELTEKEKEPLLRLLNRKKKDPESISSAILKLTLPAKGLWQNSPSYRSFLENIAKKSGILEKEILSGVSFVNESILNIEAKMLVALFQNEFEKMTDEEREQFILELESGGLKKEQISSVLALTTLVSAQASGIGIYLLASTALGAISGFFGIALPFVVYTGMSSLISTLIGPLGFLLAGIWVWRAFRKVKSFQEAWQMVKDSGKEVTKLVTGDHDKALLAFKYLASARYVKLSNANKEIQRLDSESGNELLEKRQKSIKALKDRIYEIKRSITDLQIELDQCTERIDNQQIELSALEQNKILNQRKKVELEELIDRLS